MDPNTVVLEISSDEETEWNDHCGGGISDAGDDYDWLAELLEEVNTENSGEDDGGGDSDEVVVVNEVLPAEKPEKKSELKCSLVDLDDDCVILDNDPDKPVEVRNDSPATGNDDSDDLLVVSEKGQVACRDYPHPRHLCIKYPFSATPNQNHCDQCYCYVCDSLAPCVCWGNGSSITDHCHATDKDELWRLERKNAKNPKISDPARLARMDPDRPALAPGQVLFPVPRPGLTRARYTPANFGVPNITNQTRNPVFASRNKFHPGLVPQLLLRTNGPRAHRVQRPVFKRPGSAVVAPTTNQHRYGPYRGSFGNSRKQQNHTSFEPRFSGYSNPYPDPIRNQPHLVPSSTQPEPVPCPPSYLVPCHASYPVPPQPSYQVLCHASYPVHPQTRVDSISPSVPVSDQMINPSCKDYDITRPPMNMTHQSVAPMNDPSSFLTDYQYDNWIFDNPLVEAGLMDVSGAYYDSEFIDTGPLFEF